MSVSLKSKLFLHPDVEDELPLERTFLGGLTTDGNIPTQHLVRESCSNDFFFVCTLCFHYNFCELHRIVKSSFAW